MVGAWAADAFFFKRRSLGIIRSTQPTMLHTIFLKLTPMVRLNEVEKNKSVMWRGWETSPAGWLFLSPKNVYLLLGFTIDDV